MIVTCESCKSRYKLDDSKITGRGAKITCPKCKHIFVVLSAGAAPGRPAGTPAWEEDEPTKVEDAAVYPPPRPAKPPEVAPAPKPATSPAPSPAVLPVHEVTRPTAAPVAAASGAKVDYAARAMALDFRKVGVAAWKAKIKIGLVYDFSDIKTLRRYITDGRVTPNDVISWDGKNFKPIGDIPDLDRYFVETYEMLERDQEQKGAQPAPPSQPAPTDLGNVAAVLAAAEAAKPDQVGPTFNDPFARGKQKPKTAPRTITMETPPTKKGGNWLVLAAGALLLVGVGAWYASKGENVPEAAPPQVKQPAKVDPEAERKKMLEKYAQTGQEVKTPQPGTPTPEVPAAPPEGEAPDAGSPNADVVQAEHVVGQGKVPEGFTPKAPSAEELAKQQGGKATAGAPVTSRDASASDFEELGDAAKAAGNWGEAKTSYQKAKSAGGGGAALNYKLGEAQLRSGDADGAIRTLESIKKAYPAAHALLAEAYDKVGDSAKANAERSAGGG